MTMQEIYSGDLRSNVSHELDITGAQLEQIFREIRRLRAQLDAIASGNTVRADAIQGVIPVINGGSGIAANPAGAVGVWTNSSGGALASGDVVVSLGNRTMTTTVNVADLKSIGVCTEAIANGAEGPVRHLGYQSVVNVQNAVAVGDFLSTYSTLKRAASVGGVAAAGVFAMALTAFAGPGAGTVAAYLFALDPSAGGGVIARKAAGADQGPRPRISFIEGANVTLSVSDDPGNNEIDITIASSGGAGSGDDLLALTYAVAF